jgi:hypothetical protein
MFLRQIVSEQTEPTRAERVRVEAAPVRADQAARHSQLFPVYSMPVWTLVRVAAVPGPAEPMWADFVQAQAE